MDINKDVMTYIETYIIEELLYEEEYEYYIDEVNLVIKPTSIHVYLFTENTNEVINYLVESGLKISKRINNQPTMVYKDILYIIIINCKEEYDKKKFENDQIQKISLKTIVKSMEDNGYGTDETMTLLQKIIAKTL